MVQLALIYPDFTLSTPRGVWGLLMFSHELVSVDKALYILDPADIEIRATQRCESAVCLHPVEGYGASGRGWPST